MITSLNEWRKRKAAGTLNEVASVNTASDFQQIKSLPAPIENELAIDNNDLFDQIRSVAEYAKDFDLSKIDTIGIIQKIFVDPAQAPDDISVAFVQMHLGQIVSIIDQMPDEDFPENPLTFSADMKANDLPFECVMYIPNNKTITKLVEALNVQIKKDNFKTTYENGVFFINSLEKMNENNRSKVMNILKECNAKNIGKQLKWKRKLQ